MPTKRKPSGTHIRRTDVPVTSSPSSNPKDRFGLAKVPLISCVPAAAMIYLGLAQRDGMGKYGPYNWRQKPIRLSIFVDACLRHVLSYWDGEELASDSKVPHLAHALACLAIVIDAVAFGNAIDDRPPKGAAARLLDLWKREVKSAPTRVVQRSRVPAKSGRRMAESRKPLERVDISGLMREGERGMQRQLERQMDRLLKGGKRAR